MSRRLRLILMGVVIVAVGLAVFFLLIDPLRTDVSDLETQIDETDTLIAAAQREVDNAAAIQAQGRVDEARLLELSKMMPDTAEVPSLILQVQDLADKSGIDWIQVTPGQPAGNEGAAYLTLPLSLSFTGNFYDVSDFVYRAEQMVAGPGRLLTVKDLAFTLADTQTSGSPLLNVEMTLLAFLTATVEDAASESTDTTQAPEGSDTSDTTDTTETTETTGTSQ